MQEAFMQGVSDELEKIADRATATGTGALSPILAGITSEKGKGWRTFGGSMLGGMAGGALGRAGGQAAFGRGTGRAAAGRIISQLLGGMAGGAGGAYLAHGKDKPKKTKSKKK